MRITYDAEVDALYIRFLETTVTTEHVADGVAVDRDADGRIAGIEILDARKRIGDPEVFRRVVLEDIGLVRVVPIIPDKGTPMQSERPDEDARRAYWTEQIEAACGHMAAVSDYPVDECGEAMAPLPDAADEAGVEVVFSTTRVVENFDRLFYLREGLIGDFIAIARQMNGLGWVLKVEDAYRTCRMQKYLAMKEEVFDIVLDRLRWELKGRMPSPEEMSRRLSVLVAASPKTGPHTSGSALDISVLNRDDGTELDRGGPYLELSELTPMGSPFIQPQASRNRSEITTLMAEHGFPAYPYEFWHYSKGDAHSEYLGRTGKPARYGAVDMDHAGGATTPIENPTRPLNSLDEIRSEIQRALARLGDRGDIR